VSHPRRYHTAPVSPTQRFRTRDGVAPPRCRTRTEVTPATMSRPRRCRTAPVSNPRRRRTRGDVGNRDDVARAAVSHRDVVASVLTWHPQPGPHLRRCSIREGVAPATLLRPQRGRARTGVASAAKSGSQSCRTHSDVGVSAMSDPPRYGLAATSPPHPYRTLSDVAVALVSVGRLCSGASSDLSVAATSDPAAMSPLERGRSHLEVGLRNDVGPAAGQSRPARDP
jgi:hypothetical protein